MRFGDILISHLGRHEPLGRGGILVIVVVLALVSLPEFFLHHFFSRAMRGVASTASTIAPIASTIARPDVQLPVVQRFMKSFHCARAASSIVTAIV
jgi:hypothetical protein